MQKYKAGTLVFCILLFCLNAFHLWSQDVEVYVQPSKVYTGDRVEIFGFVKPNRQITYARLELVKPVSGKTIVKKVQTQKNGKYSLIFTDTDEKGIWKVKASKEGTAISAETSFTVGSGIFLGDLVEILDKEYDPLSRSGWQELSRLLKNYPRFPGKEDMEERLKEILDRLDQMADSLRQLDQATTQLENLLEAHGGSIPETARQALARAAKKSVDTCGQIKPAIQEIESILEESREEADWCFIWLLYHDFCSKLNDVNNFVATGLKDIALNLGTAAATKGMPFPVSQAIQTVIHIATTSTVSVVGFVNYMLGTIAGLGGEIYGELLKNCSQFKGPVKGDYRLELLHKGAPFFTMSYRLEGEIDLVFQKRKPGDPTVHLKGNFKGSARDFDCSMTMIPFAVATFSMAYCHCPLPLLSLKSFNLTLEGLADDHRLRVKLKQVNRDFKLEARGFYVLLSVHQPIPIPGTLPFPLMNSQWFLTRATEISNPKIEYFELPIKAAGELSTAEKTFEREIYLPPTRNRKAVRVRLTLHIKICQPECR